MRGGMRRLIFAQPETGNIVDLDEHSVESLDYGSSPQTQMMDDSTQWVQSNQRTLSPTVTDRAAIRMLRYMAGVELPTRVIVIGGNQHLYFYKGRLVRNEQYAGIGEVGRESFSLVYGAKYGDAQVAESIVEAMPWEGAVTEPTRKISLGGVILGGRDPTDMTSVGPSVSFVRGVDGGTEIFDIKSLDVQVTLSTGDTQGIAFDGSTYYAVHDQSTPSITDVDQSGTNENNTAYYNTNLTPRDAAYDSTNDLLYIAETSNNRIDVINPSSLGSLVRSFGASSTPIKSVIHDTNALYVSRDDGTFEVWDLTTTPEELERTVTVVDTSASAGPYTAGVEVSNNILAFNSTGLLDRFRLYGLSPSNHQWNGRLWSVGRVSATTAQTIAPNVLGAESNLSSTNKAIANFIFPVWGAEVEGTFNRGVSGSGFFTARKWNGSAISSGFISNAFTIPDKTWTLEVEITSADAFPRIRVTSPGTAGGVRFGVERGASGNPNWA